jgi:hypothetical protein
MVYVISWRRSSRVHSLAQEYLPLVFKKSPNICTDFKTFLPVSPYIPLSSRPVLFSHEATFIFHIDTYLPNYTA